MQQKGKEERSRSRGGSNTAIGPSDSDEEALNAQSRVMLMAKLDRSGITSGITAAPLVNGSGLIQGMNLGAATPSFRKEISDRSVSQNETIRRIKLSPAHRAGTPLNIN
ncbi:hypothetical protein LXL04_019187 [Taraxacum kok-saghyz]